jgi:spermidine/putrescine transport system ATP-binding protein
MTNTPAVELRQVWRRYGAIAAVHDVSLAVEEGEFFSLLGPSGCGKSTTLRIIGGFDTPTEGGILIRGAPMNAVPPHRRPTNMVFQQLGLFPHLDVFDNVAFGLRLARLTRAEIARRVARQLDVVSLSGYERRFPDELSGGQRQRVAIARALANEPSVLLLDEPLGALDLRLRQKMQVELKEIQRRLGTTFVYVTHDQAEAFAMSDRIGIMNDGRLEQVDTPRRIYDAPATEFVADFVGETNLLRGQVRDDGVMLQCMTAVIPLDAGVPSGASITVSARPEHVRLLRVEPAGSQELATVQQVVFQGASVLYTLRLVGGGQLLARVPAGDPLDQLAPGDRTALQLVTSQLRLVR